jgi:hypothetical protein
MRKRYHKAKHGLWMSKRMSCKAVKNVRQGGRRYMRTVSSELNYQFSILNHSASTNTTETGALFWMYSKHYTMVAKNGDTLAKTYICTKRW